MTPKEKAKELVNKFKNYTDGSVNKYTWSESFQRKNAKKCASIAINEILNSIDFASMLNGVDDFNYWLEVKQEIEK